MYEDGIVQSSLNKKDLGADTYSKYASCMGLGIIVSMTGTYWKTQKGVKTLSVQLLDILRKPEKPIPSKFEGINDPEIKYRKRYLDLLTSKESRELFIYCCSCI